jgi:hypothetical protein
VPYPKNFVLKTMHSNMATLRTRIGRNTSSGRLTDNAAKISIWKAAPVVSIELLEKVNQVSVQVIRFQILSLPSLLPEFDPLWNRITCTRRYFSNSQSVTTGQIFLTMILVFTPPKAKFWMAAIRISVSVSPVACRIMAHLSSISSKFNVGATNPSSIM